MTTPLFAQSRVSCLTREEECLLKTALAMVVIKKRKLQKDLDEEEEERDDHDNKDLNDVNRADDDNTGRGSKKQKGRSSSVIVDKKSKLPRAASSSPLESIFQNNSKDDQVVLRQGGRAGSPRTTSSSSPLLKSPNRAHIDQIFQVARSMVITNSSSSSSPVVVVGEEEGAATTRTTRNPALAGTASHLAQQLQVWTATALAQHEQEQHQQQELTRTTAPQRQEEDGPNDRTSTSTTPATTTARGHDSSGGGAAPSSPPSPAVQVLVDLKDWIRSRLTSLDEQQERSNNINFVVFEAIIQQATDETFVSIVLSIVVKILRDLYYDEFVVVGPAPGSSSSTISKMAPPTISSRTTSSLDWLATRSLQFLYTCLGWYNNQNNNNKYISSSQVYQEPGHRRPSHYYHSQSSDHRSGGGGGGVQVLHECLAGDEELLVPLPFSRLIKAYTARRKSPRGGSMLCLDPGAKLLLRLTLYRCLLVQEF